MRITVIAIVTGALLVSALVFGIVDVGQAFAVAGLAALVTWKGYRLTSLRRKDR
jgi:hypothetical protein